MFLETLARNTLDFINRNEKERNFEKGKPIWLLSKEYSEVSIHCISISVKMPKTVAKNFRILA